MPCQWTAVGSDMRLTTVIETGSLRLRRSAAGANGGIDPRLVTVLMERERIERLTLRSAGRTREESQMTTSEIARPLRPARIGAAGRHLYAHYQPAHPLERVIADVSRVSPRVRW